MALRFQGRSWPAFKIGTGGNLQRCLCLLAVLTVVQTGNGFPSAVPSGDPAAGETLAEQIRSAMPPDNSEIHGTLIVDSKSGHTEVPVVCQVIVHTNDGIWETVYQTTPAVPSDAVKLVIIHHTDGPTQYVYLGAPVLPAAASDIGFAGSDFSLGDLGLEFLHWPGQSQFRGEMRSTRPCYVLESTNAATSGIVRVKSWIDKESLGPMDADAYDARGNLIKEFSLGGSSFVKVNGQWRLEKMDIRNKKTGSHTVLKFDIPKG